ncbi:MAG: DcrB-related protein [Myxococcota bacterium]
MRITLGTAQTEIPDGWADSSVLQFTGPAEDGTPAPMIVVTRSEPAKESFNVLLDQQLAVLEDTMVDFRELKRFTDGSATVAEYRFGDSPPLGQLLGLRDVAGVVFIVTATAPIDSFDEYRDAFLNVLRALEAA